MPARPAAAQLLARARHSRLFFLLFAFFVFSMYSYDIFSFSLGSFSTRHNDNDDDGKKNSGQQARCRCQVGGRHLPSVSYGQSYKQTYSDTGFSESSVFAHLDRIVSFHILSGRLSSNSCSAALICVFCATRRIRFFVKSLFQTFSRSDPPGKAPLTRGRYVLKKGEKKMSLVLLQKTEIKMLRLVLCYLFFKKYLQSREKS